MSPCLVPGQRQPEPCWTGGRWGPDLSQHNLVAPVLCAGNLLCSLCRTLWQLPRLLFPASYLLDFSPHCHYLQTHLGHAAISPRTLRFSVCCKLIEVAMKMPVLLASRATLSRAASSGLGQCSSWHGRDAKSPWLVPMGQIREG